MNKISNSHALEEEGHWISVSDLMAGLMMVFLLISVSLMTRKNLENNKLEETNNAIKQIAEIYQKNRKNIHKALMDEFQDDLKKWHAEINQEKLSVEFRAPEVLFRRGKTEITQRFKDILADFFPRYLEILRDYRESIDEIRIEGHTSSEWGESPAQIDDAYFKNMELSQGRTRSALKHMHSVLKTPSVPKHDSPWAWVKKLMATVGLSSSQLVLKDDGEEHEKEGSEKEEDEERSRRVTFRIMTNAEKKISEIIERLEKKAP